MTSRNSPNKNKKQVSDIDAAKRVSSSLLGGGNVTFHGDAAKAFVASSAFMQSNAVSVKDTNAIHSNPSDTPNVAKIAQSSFYSSPNEAHLVRSSDDDDDDDDEENQKSGGSTIVDRGKYYDDTKNKSQVDPHLIGNLDYEIRPSEWGCCCCCPWEMPLPCCYKRKIGAAYVCCERTKKNGEKKVLCMLGAGCVKNM